MKVVFYGNRAGDFGDKLIRWWTSDLSSKVNGTWKDSYSHVELLFSDGYMFSASQYHNICRFRKFNPGSSAWVTVTTDADEEAVRMFCEEVNGSKYDYLGILGFVIGTKHAEDKYFCSEVVVRALQSSGRLGTVISSTTSPNKLYRLLNRSTPND